MNEPKLNISILKIIGKFGLARDTFTPACEFSLEFQNMFKLICQLLKKMSPLVYFYLVCLGVFFIS